MSLLEKPVRRRKIVFMLTPLVDVMFLLLIFFMLSSQTAPYSLLLITPPPGPTAASAPAEPVESAPTPQEVMVSIFHGYVRYNGDRVALENLRASIEKSKTAGIARAAVLATQGATVQDLVTVIEAFETTDFGDMRLIMQQGDTQ